MGIVTDREIVPARAAGELSPPAGGGPAKGRRPAVRPWKPSDRRRRLRDLREAAVRGVLGLAALSSIAVTLGIVGILLYESVEFFRHVSLWRFLTDSQWTPLFSDAHYGIAPLVCATLVVALVASAVALPVGTVSALYLSEFAPHRVRETVKPLLELLSAVPTVVYGYFALLFVTPLLQKVIPGLPGFNMLSPGLVIGVMIIPYVSSVSEDAMRAVPMHLREASYALGATRLQTALRAVLPASFSGVASAYILGFSRAVGETMVVAVAGGMQPNLTLDPRQPAETITAYIVQVSLGDLPHGSLEYQTIFAAGLTLMLMTLAFNVLGHFLRRRFREAY